MKKNFNLEFLKNRLVLRCKQKGCRQYYTARSPIFSLENTSNLSIEKFIEIYWYWFFNQSVDYPAKQSHLDPDTIVRWLKKIRTILYDSMCNAHKMGGHGYRIQIDESLFQGKRKYNRGRLLSSTRGQSCLLERKTMETEYKGPGFLVLFVKKSQT
ncbi:unnamed protein product [Brachionus calyciflorus]|uniref:Uncharacterized protein n=1 Tax=Brachionus calyciflorus TaxID=104777 RepID=A0A814I494_9BILA|nr:unnamed protein product [Brachionus calyciflorus]